MLSIVIYRAKNIANNNNNKNVSGVHLDLKSILHLKYLVSEVQFSQILDSLELSVKRSGDSHIREVVEYPLCRECLSYTFDLASAVILLCSVYGTLIKI